METMGERLKWARKKAGFRSARAAALENEWKEVTYRSHETGGRGFDYDSAIRYARVFRVDAMWLLHGVATEPKPDVKSLPIMGYVGAGAEILPEFEQVPPEGLDTIDIPFAVPPDLIGLEVKGDSMLPRYEDGDVIIVWKDQRGSFDMLLGEEAAVRTQRGRRYLKRLLRGADKGTYNLESTNASAKTIEGVRLEWASEIYLTVRAAQIKRIAARERAVRTRRQNARTRETEGMGRLPLDKETGTDG
jgi:hypothetical protein